MENQKLKIRIKYPDKSYPKLQKITKGDWIDLYTAHDTKVYIGKDSKIDLGVCMELPEGYEGHLLPRSSTFRNYGVVLTNSMGIIDESYKGDNDRWGFNVFCLQIPGEEKKEYVEIPRHAKIAQFRIMKKMPEVDFEEVESLNNEDRGGFGSTGKF